MNGLVSYIECLEKLEWLEKMIDQILKGSHRRSMRLVIDAKKRLQYIFVSLQQGILLTEDELEILRLTMKLPDAILYPEILDEIIAQSEYPEIWTDRKYYLALKLKECREQQMAAWKEKTILQAYETNTSPETRFLRYVINLKLKEPVIGKD